MGAPMARNLMKAGHQVALWTHSPGKAEKVAREIEHERHPAVRRAATA